MHRLRSSLVFVSLHLPDPGHFSSIQGSLDESRSKQSFWCLATWRYSWVSWRKTQDKVWSSSRMSNWKRVCEEKGNHWKRSDSMPQTLWLWCWQQYQQQWLWSKGNRRSINFTQVLIWSHVFHVSCSCCFMCFIPAIILSCNFNVFAILSPNSIIKDKKNTSQPLNLL